MRALGTHAPSRQDGYTLAAVLWVLGLLAVAVSSMSFFTVSSLAVVTVTRERVAAEALVRAGVETAALEIMYADPVMPMLGSTTLKAATGDARVAWRGETGLIDLNVAPAELLQTLFRNAGASEADALSITEAIIERRASDGRTVVVPFSHVAQIGEIGAPNSLLRRVRPSLTVYNGQPRIDPRIASRDVLSTFPGMTEGRLRNMLTLRERNVADVAQWTNEVGESARFLTFERSPVIRVRVDARVNTGLRASAEVVIAMFPDDKEPYRVLDWDESPADRRLESLDGGLP